MAGGTLSSVIVYPLKSAAGVMLDSAVVEEHGLALDRRWMLVGEGGGFLSQRELPRMALLRVEVAGDHLSVQAPAMPPLHLELEPKGSVPVTTHIWADTCTGLAVDPEADAWFGSFLRVDCRLVYIPSASFRTVDQEFAEPGDHVGYADGFPFLLASASSLDDFNKRANTDLPMNRFRPNLVVTGFEPYAEDEWRHVRIGGMGFRVVKPCARCNITTVDQTTGETGKEPLRTLANYRRVGGNVLFGQNLIHDGRGVLRVGYPVLVEN